MLLRKLLFVIFVLSFGVAKSGDFPLKISEVQSQNSIVNYKGQPLILVDFWATWCIPCRAATTQLEILQEQLKEDVFIVSITDETHDIVRKHIGNHPSKLLVARDVEGNLMQKFRIYSRPYAILFNSDGDAIWRGHPSELTYDKIKRFQHKFFRGKKKRTIREILFISDNQKEYKKNNEEISISVEKIKDSNTMLIRDAQGVNYYGTISDLIAQLKQVPSHFIEMNNAKDFFVHLQSPTTIWNKNPDVLLRLLNAKFGIRITEKPIFEEVYTLKVVAQEKLWSVNQIDWGEDNVYNYLTGEDRVQADNLTIKDFCILLSNIKKKNYKYFGENNDLHDWDVHFLFDDLMESELFSEFGIKLKEEYTEVVHFSVE